MENNEIEITIAQRRDIKENSIIGFPWVFWISIDIRKNWFSYWYKSRGSNAIEFQVWIFRISIGRPWIKRVLLGQLRDYNSLEYTKETNNNNLNNPFSFQIGSYKNI